MAAKLDRIVIRLAGVVVDALPLDQPVITIGRAADTAITLAHPCISRHHAEIRSQAGVTTIVDLGSANGVIVAGVHVPAHQPQPLTPGAVVQIGPYTLTLQTLGSDEQASEALGDTTVLSVQVELRIDIDVRELAVDVEEITGSEFFQHLRAERDRLRRHDAHPAA